MLYKLCMKSAKLCDNFALQRSYKKGLIPPVCNSVELSTSNMHSAGETKTSEPQAVNPSYRQAYLQAPPNHSSLCCSTFVCWKSPPRTESGQCLHDDQMLGPRNQPAGNDAGAANARS